MAIEHADKAALVRLVNCENEDEVIALTGLLNRAFAVENFFLVRNHVEREQVKRAAKSGTFLRMEQNGEMVGTVYCSCQGECGLLGMLAVEPKKQGLGFGRLLVQEAEQFLRRHGCHRAELRVVNLRAELLPFYRKLGYKETRLEPFPPEISVTRNCHLIRLAKYL
jgi:GNAT superfamily N-acetyltransferase